jgi:lipopolysaccharide transport system ATP-binding protein
VVDEVLAVGDLEFQKKCLGKMKDVASSGRTVLFVSHQMQAVQTLCTKGIFLSAGKVDYIGDVSETISRYLSSRGQIAPDATAKSVKRSGSGELRFTSFSTDKQVYLSLDTIEIDMEVTEITSSQPGYFISLEVVNALGLTVLHLDSRLLNAEFSAAPKRGIRFSVRQPRLAQGDYTIHAYLCTPRGIIDRLERAGDFTIAPLLPYPASRSDCVRHAMVYPEFAVEESPAAATPSRVVAQTLGV